MSQDDERNEAARHYAAADLSRILPSGTSLPPVQAPPTAYDELSYPAQQAGGPAVVTPLPRPKPIVRSSGMPKMSLPGRIVVGIALAASLGWMVWNAWLNIVGR